MNNYGVTVCKATGKEYKLLDGADFSEGNKKTSIYSAPAVDNEGIKYICSWYFENEDIADIDLEDIDWTSCDEVQEL